MADLETTRAAEVHRPTITSTSESPRVGVVGVAGYAGGELARILLRHPRVATGALTFFGRSEESGPSAPRSLSDIHPQLLSPSDMSVVPFSLEELRRNRTEVLLLATPHEQSRAWVPELLAMGTRVIDLSGAWRLQEAANRSIYGLSDKNPELAAVHQAEAVYGSPELHKDAIRTARLVANPGCYATSILLALAPLIRAGVVDLVRGIVCDAKSGVSGAGKRPSPNTHFMYAADNLSAYAVFGHRHTGELLEQLALSGPQIQFTPHLLPIPRGIFSTIYLRLAQRLDQEAVFELMRSFYAGCPFVRLRRPGMLPQIQHVVHTNFCDIGIVLEESTCRLVIVSCLDNLLKGAAGQAIQNMNLMLGWGETEGLL